MRLQAVTIEAVHRKRHMPETPDKKRKKTEPNADESLLISAAKAIGNAAGAVAAIIGAKSPAPTKEKKVKFQPKNKTRLPRRQKKALQKAAAREG